MPRRIATPLIIVARIIRIFFMAASVISENQRCRFLANERGARPRRAKGISNNAARTKRCSKRYGSAQGVQRTPSATKHSVTPDQMSRYWRERWIVILLQEKTANHSFKMTSTASVQPITEIATDFTTSG